MKIVVIESPYKGDIERNRKYLNECIRDCVVYRNETPYASHKMLTESLDDNNESERELGIRTGLQFLDVAEKQVFYVDHGISKGMQGALEFGNRLGIKQEFRVLYEKNRYKVAEWEK